MIDSETIKLVASFVRSKSWYFHVRWHQRVVECRPNASVHTRLVSRPGRSIRWSLRTWNFLQRKRWLLVKVTSKFIRTTKRWCDWLPLVHLFLLVPQFFHSHVIPSFKNISGVCTSQVFMQKCSSGWEEDEPNELTRNEKQICESCYRQRSRQKINKWINGETAGQRASQLGTIEFWVCYNTSRSGNEQNAFKRRTRLSRNSVTAIL